MAILSCFSSVPQAQEQEAERVATRLVEITRAWWDGKPSSPGASAEVREVTRKQDSGRLMVRYHVWLKGVPKDQSYAAFSWPTNAAGPSPMMQGLTLSPEGMVICAGRTPEQCGSSDRKDDPVEFTFVPSKGEIFRLGLASTDGKTKVYFALVPDPIIRTDKRCTLEAVRLMPKFEIAMIRAKGFAANEPLQLYSKSYDETHDMQLAADGNGELTMALLPGVKDKNTGTTSLTLKGAACAPSVSFDWGQ